MLSAVGTEQQESCCISFGVRVSYCPRFSFSAVIAQRLFARLQNGTHDGSVSSNPCVATKPQEEDRDLAWKIAECAEIQPRGDCQVLPANPP